MGSSGELQRSTLLQEERGGSGGAGTRAMRFSAQMSGALGDVDACIAGGKAEHMGTDVGRREHFLLE